MFAVIILVSAMLRPPGTMLVLHGDTITFTLCSGSEVKTVTIALDDEDSQEIDLSCDVCTTQLAALPVIVPLSIRAAIETTCLHRVLTEQAAANTNRWSPYTSRAPPLLS